MIGVSDLEALRHLGGEGPCKQVRIGLVLLADLRTNETKLLGIDLDGHVGGSLELCEGRWVVLV